MLIEINLVKKSVSDYQDKNFTIEVRNSFGPVLKKAQLTGKSAKLAKEIFALFCKELEIKI